MRKLTMVPKIEARRMVIGDAGAPKPGELVDPVTRNNAWVTLRRIARRISGLPLEPPEPA